MQKDDVFIGVSTCFGNHHAHQTPTVYSTGRAAADSRRRGGWCALVGNGFATSLNTRHQENGTKLTTPMVYSTGCAAEDSWRRDGWCALVGNGFTTSLNAHHQENGTKPTTPMVYSTGRAAVDSWRRGG
jgi:hypothetical protein